MNTNFRRSTDMRGDSLLPGGSRLGLLLCFVMAVAASAAVVTQVAAAPFGVQGTAIPPIHIPGAQGAPMANLQQADGKIVVVGTADGPVAATIFAARFSAAGVADSTYGVGGIVYIDIPPDLARLAAGAATLDANGNLLIVGEGSASYPNSASPMLVVVRLLPTGVADPTFGVAGLVRPIVPTDSERNSGTAVAIDSQGRIVVGGGMSNSSAGFGGFLVVRLLSTGALDTSFNSTGYRIANLSPYTSAASSLALTSGDGVVVAGNDNPFVATPFAVVRLTAAGAFDPAFGGTGVVLMDGGRYAGVDAADRVLVATQGGMIPQDSLAVTRLTPAGIVDASYGVGGTATIPMPGQLFGMGLSALRIDSAGRTVLAARGLDGTGTAFYALRLTPGGILDSGFGVAGIADVSTDLFFIDGVALGLGQGNSILLSGGTFYSLVVHLTAAGLPDTTFNSNGSLKLFFGAEPLTLTGMARQTDGKLVLVGFGPGSFYTPANNFVVARLTLAGNLDPTFNGTGFRAIETADNSSNLNSIALDGAGRIVLAGRDYFNHFRVVRLLADGAFDPAFNGTGTVTVVDTPMGSYQPGLAVDSQSRILLAGGSILRLAASGAVDPSFGVGGMVPLPILPPNGHLPFMVDGSDRPLVGGALSDGTIPTFAVARLTTSGLPDATFGSGGTAIISLAAGMMGATVGAMAIDGTGRIVAAGPATTNVAALGAVVRLLPTGALDGAFNATGVSIFPGTYGYPNAVTLDQLGRVVVTGEGYTNRLNPNGTVDPTFNAAQPVVTSILQGSNLLRSQAVFADASGIYVGGTAGRTFAVVRLFSSTPIRLAMFAAVPGTPTLAATPFDQVVQAQDAAGNPQPVTLATSVGISLTSGTLLGITTCTIPAGHTFCIVTGVAFPVFGYQQLQAAVTSGDALAPVVWQPVYVDWAPVTVAIVSDSPNPSNFGQAITVTATINVGPALSVPTGFISVTWGSASGCFIALPATSCTFTPGAAGTQPLVASFQGNSTFSRADSPAVAHTVTPSSVPPVLMSVVSRKAHGAAGVFDVPLVVGAPLPAVEPRVGPAHTIVFSFNKQIIASTATVTEGIATMSSRFNSGAPVLVSLANVADSQYVTISLSNVNAVDGSTTTASIRLGFLAGDVNQSGTVSLADLGAVNAQLAQPVTQINFQKDVNANGAITLSDKVVTNANLTHSLP